MPYLSDREHLANGLLNDLVVSGRVLLVEDHPSGQVLGWLRWCLFWDDVPFMNMLFVREDQRRKGLGRQLVTEWETRCRQSGYGTAMTSMLSSEAAQHFYRRLGYRDAGCLLLPGEALEIFFTKILGSNA